MTICPVHLKLYAMIKEDEEPLEVLKDFSLRLSKSISKLGKRMYQKSGAVDWESATRYTVHNVQDMAMVIL